MRFVSGHDFSRAEEGVETVGFSPCGSAAAPRGYSLEMRSHEVRGIPPFSQKEAKRMGTDVLLDRYCQISR
jgi:hypothetical protein